MSAPRPGSLISELPAPRPRTEVLIKRSVLQAQSLSFALDKLAVMSKVTHTTYAHAIKELRLKASVKPSGQRVYTKGRLFSTHQSLYLAFLNCH